MSKRSPHLLLEDIIVCAVKILIYTNGLSFEQFLADDKTIDAVIRNFEIIGEAAIKENFLQAMIADIRRILPNPEP